MIKPRVFLDGYPWDFRSRNSDWSYVERKMPRVSDWASDVQFVPQHSLKITVRANYKALRAAVGRRIGLPLPLWKANTDGLDEAELKRSGCNMVFSHREFPLNSQLPVIWMNAVVDPEMTMSAFGTSAKEIQQEIETKGSLFRRSAMIQVCTHAEAARHARTFPDIAERFVAVPLFGPHLTSGDESLLSKHHDSKTTKLLFVGNSVRLKGLQRIVDAYLGLPLALRKMTQFTIVSNFDRGRASIPDDPRISIRRNLSQADVLNLMREAHILVNPSRFESYGMIFLEAMSQGTLCIGPDWEVQRELFDGGRAGINVFCDVPLIQRAMMRAIEDQEGRTRMVTEAWNRFNLHYQPSVVARQYAELFRSVAGKL